MKNFKTYLTHTSDHFSKKQFSIYTKRLNDVNLTWCNQVLDFIETTFSTNVKSINERAIALKEVKRLYKEFGFTTGMLEGLLAERREAKEN